MDAPTPPQRPSQKRGALVVATILADFAWVATHIPALGALGLVDGEAGFYAGYQAGRCLIAGVALAWALRSGWFSAPELGLAVARHGPALRWLAKAAAVAIFAAALVLVLGRLVLPSLVCELSERALWAPVVYPWPVFVRDTICMVLLAPLYEEIMYRAILLSALRERFKDSHALVIGGGVFVVLHYLYGYGWNTGYLLVALALGWVFLRTGSILPGILLHAANNLWFTASSHGRYVLGDAAILDWLCGR
ncbi:CPBP family intramembrane glutamic endopeptidase [Nannocystis bainbridge]|uniref:Type II CAAX endopeptidase family protein n=1 Tax=Nannocystis bainbridge TaxID=2995303 RepID=A0ABT5E2W6_9BACT|nr:type II CAAX endopeptidase family protein [Nannocystis bainbridge]MDC0719102.1 type II CAAX endopeptidase family protein [Nannocystis bainbridge]